MSHIYIKPADGMVVSDPDVGPRARLPEAGARRRRSRYWSRRLLDGDVVEIAPPAKKSSSKAKKSEPKES